MSEDKNNTQTRQRQIEYRRFLKENNLLPGPRKIGKYEVFRNGTCVLTTDDRKLALDYIYNNTGGLSYDEAMANGWGYKAHGKAMHGNCGEGNNV